MAGSFLWLLSFHMMTADKLVKVFLFIMDARDGRIIKIIHGK
jgi:hypothetical protein